MSITGVAIVVGGTSGIGAAIVDRLIRRDLYVVALGLEAAPQTSAAGEASGSVASRRPHETLIGDARDQGQLESLVGQAMEAAARLDVPFVGAVHVAGGSGRRFGDGPLDQISLEAWRQTVEWNLESVFLSNRAVLKRLLEQDRGGSIVNLSSVLATHPAPAHFNTHAYAAAKGGITALTLAAAAHYARNNIRLNVIAPGLIDTPMAARAMSDASIQDYLRNKQPLNGGGAGEATEVAGAAAWLLSDEAKWITGQCLAVDGGWSVSEPG